MILDDLFEGNLPPNIRPSDLPPGMRQRLSMRDIEAQRPQSAMRFRVGEKEFIDLRAAREFAAGTGERVQRIGEDRGQKKTANPRIDRILKQLRARHPQAEDDLEALIYDFRSQQAQDRRDIGQLYAQDAEEDEAIERLEKMLDVIRQRRGIDATADVAEEKIDRKSKESQDNFTISDIKRLETVTDLETLKAQAKQLIKGKPARRMKPEKIAYFYDKIDGMPSRLTIIKLMYDLLLSGEGHQVLGTKWGMNPNAYRSRFGEGIKVSRDENENIIVDEAKKDACYNKVRSRYKVWPSAYASGALVQCRKKGADNWGNKS